jgi:hypothetical protein
LTALSQRNSADLENEIFLYWSNKGEYIKGIYYSTEFVNELISAEEHLSINYYSHPVCGMFNGVKLRFYSMRPSMKFSLLYSVDEKLKLVRIRRIAPSRGKYFNDFMKKKDN